MDAFKAAPGIEIHCAVIPDPKPFGDLVHGGADGVKGQAGHLLEVVDDRIGGEFLDVVVGEHLTTDDNVDAVLLDFVDADGGIVPKLGEPPFNGFDHLGMTEQAVGDAKSGDDMNDIKPHEPADDTNQSGL